MRMECFLKENLKSLKKFFKISKGLVPEGFRELSAKQLTWVRVPPRPQRNWKLEDGSLKICRGGEMGIR